MKVLVVDDWGGRHYYEPFESFGECELDHRVLWNNPESISAVLFTGGSDISPSLYGDKPAARTYCNPKRDIFEKSVVDRAIHLGLPLIGVCRGSQFLCAIAGGKLYQHVNGHDWPHHMQTSNNRKFVVSSTHHQMMRLPKEAVLLGWSACHQSDTYIGSDDEVEEIPDKEVEVAYFPNIRAIGMQYHPEMMRPETEGYKYASEVVREYLLEYKVKAA